MVRRKGIEGKIRAVVFSDIDLAAGPYGVRLETSLSLSALSSSCEA